MQQTQHTYLVKNQYENSNPNRKTTNKIIYATNSGGRQAAETPMSHPASGSRQQADTLWPQLLAQTAVQTKRPSLVDRKAGVGACDLSGATGRALSLGTNI